MIQVRHTSLTRHNNTILLKAQPRQRMLVHSLTQHRRQRRSLRTRQHRVFDIVAPCSVCITIAILTSRVQPSPATATERIQLRQRRRTAVTRTERPSTNAGPRTAHSRPPQHSALEVPQTNPAVLAYATESVAPAAGVATPGVPCYTGDPAVMAHAPGD